MQIWLIVGVILTITGMANVIILSRNKLKPNKKGEIPTLKQYRLYKFMSLFTFMLGLYFTISTLSRI